MLILLLLLVIQIANPTDYIRRIVYCDGVIFRDVYYEKQILFQRLVRPYSLVFHKFSNKLFFSQTVIRRKKRNNTKITVCDVVKKKCEDVKGIKGGYTIAYDPGNDDIFMGGHEGIYKYNFLTKTPEIFAEQNRSIWEIFIRKNFYYIRFPSQRLYVYQDDKFTKVAEAAKFEIDHFHVSKHMEIYYANNTAVFKVENQAQEAIVMNDDISVRQITEDTYGDIYFAGNEGIYIEDRPNWLLQRVSNIDGVYGLAFDEEDNPIISDARTIFKLLPSKVNRPCYNLLIKQFAADDGKTTTEEPLSFPMFRSAEQVKKKTSRVVYLPLTI